MLACVECGAIARDRAVGWEAHLAYDPREDEASFVVAFCAACAAREFGDDAEIPASRPRQELHDGAQFDLMDGRTRSGKIVGSYRQPLERWTYWPEKNWTTREDGFVVVAPSGARFEWVKDEAEALLLAETRNRENR